ncbi:MAG: hypothetical protein PUB77_07720 [Clostridiales bacterium]|nr:hypothetical protein [Clostridiales bacterium]
MSNEKYGRLEPEAKRIAIRDQSGKEIGAFYYSSGSRPTPLQLAQAQIRLKWALAPLMHIDITADGQATSKRGKKILRNAENGVCALIDSLLGYQGAAKAFFETTRPFARIGGRFFCEQCISIIEQTVGE